MDQFEVAGHALQLLPRLCAFNFDFEESVVIAVPIGIFEKGCGELLICRVEWRGDVMREEIAICHEMAKLDEIAILHWLTWS